MKKNKIVETLGSRKFWFTVIPGGMGIGLFLFGQIDIDQMIQIVRWAAGIYVGGLSFIDAVQKLLPILESISATGNVGINN